LISEDEFFLGPIDVGTTDSIEVAVTAADYLTVNISARETLSFGGGTTATLVDTTDQLPGWCGYYITVGDATFLTYTHGAPASANASWFAHFDNGAGGDFIPADTVIFGPC